MPFQKKLVSVSRLAESVPQPLGGVPDKDKLELFAMADIHESLANRGSEVRGLLSAHVSDSMYGCMTAATRHTFDAWWS